MLRSKNTKPLKSAKTAVEVEKAFRQVARRMEEIRREYGSAEAYQEEFRSKHSAKQSPQENQER
jgi:hypothetical protein